MKALLALAVFAGTLHAELENELTRHLPDHTHTDSLLTATLGWESAYYLEGRNSLDGDSIASANLELNYKNFIAGAWYGFSPESDYDEANFYLEYGFELGGFEAFIGYTGLLFLSDDTFDHDLSIGVNTPELPGGLVASATAIRTLRGDGVYYTAALSREFNPLTHLTLAPSISVNFNNDYIADGGEGLDHLLFRLDASYEIDHRWILEGFLAYSMAVDSNSNNHPDDELLEDFVFAGISLIYPF